MVTEKIDGTNAQVHIVKYDDPLWDDEEYGNLSHDSHYVVARDYDKELYMFAGSRKRYVTPDDDNHGFARWVTDNADELFKFGPGRHYGEWWGLGIQRGYGLEEKRLSMFNPKWADQGPSCVTSTPILMDDCPDLGSAGYLCMKDLNDYGSKASPGFMDPEGVVVFHTAANQMFKQTFDYDEGKWSAK